MKGEPKLRILYEYQPNAYLTVDSVYFCMKRSESL